MRAAPVSLDLVAGAVLGRAGGGGAGGRSCREDDLEWCLDNAKTTTTRAAWRSRSRSTATFAPEDYGPTRASPFREVSSETSSVASGTHRRLRRAHRPEEFNEYLHREPFSSEDQYTTVSRDRLRLIPTRVKRAIRAVDFVRKPEYAGLGLDAARVRLSRPLARDSVTRSWDLRASSPW